MVDTGRVGEVEVVVVGKGSNGQWYYSSMPLYITGRLQSRVVDLYLCIQRTPVRVVYIVNMTAARPSDERAV